MAKVICDECGRSIDHKFITRHKGSAKCIRYCVECGDSYFPSHPGQRFCSRQCWLGKYNTEDLEHGQKGNKRATEVIAEKYRGTGTRGYIKRGGRHEHRVVMEEVLGRPLQPGEIVHHKDDDKHNNDPSNLEVLTQSEHTRIHLPKMMEALRKKRAKD